MIVTHEGDSLNCRITKVKPDYIYFVFKHQEEVRNTLMPVSQVKTHQLGYYQTPEIPKGRVLAHEVYPRFRAAVNGGYSYRIAKLADNTPSDFENYMKDLRSGGNYGIDVSYYFSEQMGVGLKYNAYRSKNEIGNVYVTNNTDGSTRYGTMSDNITVSFMGPSFCTRLMNMEKKNCWVMNFALGYMGYTNKARLIDPYKLTSSTLGFAWDIGYDFGISNELSIGIQLSYVGGSLSQYKITNGYRTETIKIEDSKNYENLNRFDFSVGLRLNK